MKSRTAAANVQTVGVDLAKEVFQVVCADANLRIVQSMRLKRPDLLNFWNNLKPLHVVMEACASAHRFMSMANINGASRQPASCAICSRLRTPQ